MPDFQDLEIRLQAVDNASQVLQKVVDQLEQIKKLTSGSNTITTTSGNSSAKQIQGVKSLNSEYEKAKSNLDELIRKQNLLNEALKKGAYAEGEGKTLFTQYLSSNGKFGEDLDKEILKAREQLASVQQKLNSTTQQQNSVNKELSSTQNSLSNSTKNLKDNQQKLEETTQKTAKSFAKLATKAAAIVIIVKRLAKGLYSAVEESGAFVENLNLFAVTFGENYQETLDWALEFADNLGVASNEIVRFTGLFKQLADSIGITEDIATDMSQVLTQLGYDRQMLSLYTEMCIEEPCEHTNVWCEQYKIAC